MALHNGLGNQLFEMAAGYALATRLSAPLRYDPTGLDQPDVVHLLPSWLWHPATTVELLRCASVQGSGRRLLHRTQRHVLARLLEAGGLPPRRLPPGLPRSFDPRFDELVAPCHLAGYFQNPSYFVPTIGPFSDTICEQVGLEAPSGGPPVVAVQYRRGDYVPRRWDLPGSYYEDALALVAEELGDVALRVFSDDPLFAELARDRLATRGWRVLPPEAPVHPVEAVDQLMAMARCCHQVLANSTFGWWGVAGRAPATRCRAARDLPGGLAPGPGRRAGVAHARVAPGRVRPPVTGGPPAVDGTTRHRWSRRRGRPARRVLVALCLVGASWPGAPRPRRHLGTRPGT